MSYSAKLWLLVAIVAIVAVSSAYALAQQGGEPPAASANLPATFSVSPAGDSAVLLDGRSGRTWLLIRSIDRTQPAVWLPVERLDQPEQAAKWDAAERERQRVLQQNAPLERRLTELRSNLTKIREQSVDPNNPLLKQLEKSIAAIEEQLRTP